MARHAHTLAIAITFLLTTCHSATAKTTLCVSCIGSYTTFASACTTRRSSDRAAAAAVYQLWLWSSTTIHALYAFWL